MDVHSTRPDLGKRKASESPPEIENGMKRLRLQQQKQGNPQEEDSAVSLNDEDTAASASRSSATEAAQSLRSGFITEQYAQENNEMTEYIEMNQLLRDLHFVRRMRQTHKDRNRPSTHIAATKSAHVDYMDDD